MTNTGNVTVSGIKVEDELAGAKLAFGESDTITSLAPGKSADVHFTYVVTEADILAGSIKNTATAGGSNPNGTPWRITAKRRTIPILLRALSKSRRSLTLLRAKLRGSAKPLPITKLFLIVMANCVETVETFM